MKRLALLAAASLFFAAPAEADKTFGIGVKAGTLGIGVEGTWRPPVPWLDFRVGVNAYDFSDNGTYSSIPYDGTLSLDSYYATANIRFPLSPFRVTAGIYDNGNELQLTSTGSGIYEIGGLPFAQPPFRYQAKCLSRLRALHAALPEDARAAVNPVLEETGCLPFLAS